MRETTQRTRANKKGFTLVELIVVLVILAVLAAMLVPALTGYIDKSKKNQIVADCRRLIVAAQSILDEKYGLDIEYDHHKIYAGIDELAELPENKYNGYVIYYDKETYKIKYVVICEQGEWTTERMFCVYDCTDGNAKYTVGKVRRYKYCTMDMTSTGVYVWNEGKSTKVDLSRSDKYKIM